MHRGHSSAGHTHQPRHAGRRRRHTVDTQTRQTRGARALTPQAADGHHGHCLGQAAVSSAEGLATSLSGG